MNPKNMGRMMRQLGIKNKDLDAKRVTIELSDGSKIIIEPAQVQAVEMQGTKTYTVTGTEKEENSIPEEDIKMVAEQAGVTEEEAKSALEVASGDIAQAIMDLKK